jgi:hypothetical protein
MLLCVELLNKALTGMTLLWTLVVALAVATARSALRIRSAFTALGSRLARALRWPRTGRSCAQGVLFLRIRSLAGRARQRSRTLQNTGSETELSALSHRFGLMVRFDNPISNCRRAEFELQLAPARIGNSTQARRHGDTARLSSNPRSSACLRPFRICLGHALAKAFLRSTDERLGHGACTRARVDRDH